ncbi:DUF1028 domain-containing protein [Halanaerobiaceae bacterium Z-7014]|uniref:DUF1028 domain-containing protein n=1 Tax=Halonatronomonas betaini TaxID=2778430 RepID=A0A931AT30_9FIRM|nr:DUF1028 domain-containing protein [Halonatronomonas betaini]MBF8437391.1 DUF1028 domain-containing protein [Halonatronomonas betaini]
MKTKKTSTFSIIGFDPETEELGVAVQSKFLAAGAIVPYIKAGVGAIATQALANPAYGPDGIELLEKGHSPSEVIEILTEQDDGSRHRQLGIVDIKGRSANFTGDECLDWAGGLTGENFAVQGNILVNKETVEEMAKTFEKTEGRLADRLLKALEAGQAAGGDSRGQQAAALLVYKENGGYGGLTDKYIDLRVDDHPEPIEKLAGLLDLFYLYFLESDVDHVELKGQQLIEVQELLVDFGLYDGPVDGEFNQDFEKALNSFYSRENFEERIPEGRTMPLDILEYLRSRV